MLTNNLGLLRAAGPGLNDAQEDGLARIERTTQRMKRLLSGVRNFARAGSDIEFTGVPLEEVVAESLEMLAQVIDERAAEVIVEGPLPTIVGDHDQLVQLFQNLLSNAIKFGPRRGRVVISATRQEDAVAHSRGR